jgi:diguanylate cyclase (GGDEF)-like protein/PAS domain S-box-containing protein
MPAGAMTLLNLSWDYQTVLLAIPLTGTAAWLFGRFVLSRTDRTDTSHEPELHFRTMAEAVPEFIWTANPDGAVDYANQKCLDYAGVSSDELQGGGWIALVHPDDLDPCLAKWESALRTGNPYDMQYRLRGADGTYHWFLCRGNPIRDAKGMIVKWCGTCSDIEDQKKNQQILEEQILERTMQLADINRRMQQEMSEKDIARKQLDEQNKKMMGDLEKRSDRATLLAQMGELLQSCISRDEVISVALGFAPKIFPGVRGAVALLDPARSQAEVMGSWNECQIPSTEFDSTACWALRTGHSHLVAQHDSTARCAHAEGVNASYICIPILAQGETLGIVHLQATIDGQLESAELSFKATFAGQVGLSIANIRLREALRMQSVRDSLTGLYNRRYLEELLERETRRASRGAYPLGVLMIDLDHFKNFNDTFGHEAGDAVLREAGLSLVKSVRAEDFVCRFGGEEFVIVLPTANAQASQARAERLRLKIKELTVTYQGRSMGMVTISVGVAVFPEHGNSPKDLMAAADAALYEAKRGGRDQVAVAARKALEEPMMPHAAKSGAS